jgi:8-amino-7-oxononanoate synthase
MPCQKTLFIDQELLHRKERGQFRKLQTINPLETPFVLLNGQKMLNFSSNDYLGLARHPLLKERAIEYMELYGNGSTASRLVCGNFPCFDDLENKIALLKGSEASLLLNSGFQANSSFLPALADRNSLIVADRLSHNSLIQGSLLSRSKLVRFQHNDMAHLEKILADNSKNKFNRTFIVTESVFSMDGDRCDLDAVEFLAEKYQAFLVVDEAHATGVFGENGMGLACSRNFDLVMGTFGKACGSFGAYLACSQDIRDFMINCCAGLVYSTALPPSVIGSIDAALQLIPHMDAERAQLLSKADYLRDSLNELDFDTGDSSTQIIPIIVGSEEDTMRLAKWLVDHHILASAIRPPTVEAGRSRIRLALSVSHEQEHLDKLIDLLRKWRAN